MESDASLTVFYEGGLSGVMYEVEPKSAYHIVNTRMFCFELFS